MEGKMAEQENYNEVALECQSFQRSFGEKQNTSGRERVREWRDEKRSIGKFCRLWWCWKGNVLDRQSMPLVKFFHCVSFLNQTLLQSSSSYFFLFRCLIRILLLSFCASFHFLSLRPSPSFTPSSLSLSSILNHASRSVFFLISLQSFANSPLSFFMLPSSPIHLLFTLPPPSPVLFSALFSTPTKVIYWVDGLLFSRMQITLKSLPISDQAPGPR